MQPGEGRKLGTGMTDVTFCPATMCPLFAAAGSSFSGAVNAPCERDACRWFDGAICQAGRVATGEVAMASAGEGDSWPRLSVPMRSRVFDCLGPLNVPGSCNRPAACARRVVPWRTDLIRGTADRVYRIGCENRCFRRNTATARRPSTWSAIGPRSIMTMRSIPSLNETSDKS